HHDRFESLSKLVLLFLGKGEDLVDSSRVHSKQGVVEAFIYVAVVNGKLISALDKISHQFAFTLSAADTLAVFRDCLLCRGYLNGFIFKHIRMHTVVDDLLVRGDRVVADRKAGMEEISVALGEPVQTGNQLN